MTVQMSEVHVESNDTADGTVTQSQCIMKAHQWGRQRRECLLQLMHCQKRSHHCLRDNPPSEIWEHIDGPVLLTLRAVYRKTRSLLDAAKQ